MGNSMYQKGANFERAVVEWHRRNGWQAIRSAGSHSEVDVICWKLNRFRIIQCKVQNEKRSYTREIDALKKVPAMAILKAERLLLVRFKKDVTCLDVDTGEKEMYSWKEVRSAAD